MHLAVAPILLPLAAGALLISLSTARVTLQRSVSLAGVLLLAVVALLLVQATGEGGVTVYRLGNWAPPFGIVLVVDRLSAALLLLTSLVAAGALLYARAGTELEGRYFHALLQFQLMGINGAFLTGDIFNLFVFFEVLLIASYGLLAHGRGAARPRATLHVVALNLVGSALFLFAVGAIYGVTGTLNFADLARVLPQLPAADTGIARTGALLLLVVFLLKAAVLPVLFWMPRAYGAAPAAVVALFAVLTKVGAYAILRVFTQVFGADSGATAGVVDSWVLPLGLATLLFGSLGALAAPDLPRLATSMVVASMGQLLAIIGLFTTQGSAAAVYYLLHSTLATAALFLLFDLIRAQRPVQGARLQSGEAVRQPVLLGAAFSIVGLAFVGLPPTSGFIGKVLALTAAWNDPRHVWFWGITLVGSLLLLVALARAASLLFWKTGASAATAKPALKTQQAALAVPLLGLLALVVFAQPLLEYAAAVAAQIADGARYTVTVLGDPDGAIDAQRREYP